MCAVPAVLCHLYLPAGPKLPPSAAVTVPTEALGFGAWAKRFWAAVSNRTLFLIAVITGVEAGVISTWGGIMPQQLSTKTSAVASAKLYWGGCVFDFGSLGLVVVGCGVVAVNCEL